MATLQSLTADFNGEYVFVYIILTTVYSTVSNIDLLNPEFGFLIFQRPRRRFNRIFSFP